MKVLVVDDEPLARRRLVRMLARLDDGQRCAVSRRSLAVLKRRLGM